MEKILSNLIEKTQSIRNTYKPLFFRLRNSESKNSFFSLLETPGILVCDEILGQVEELVKCRNPKKVFKREDLRQEALNFLGKSPWEEFGVWVYYPWSNRLVHILDENEFVEVRTNRNQYKITPEEKEILSKVKVGVIGLSVGQSISLTMAMERSFGELRLADFDILELSNLNRIRTGVKNLGIAKVVSVAREIAEIDPYLKVTCNQEGLTEDNIDSFLLENGKLDILVDECDGLYIKILCRQRAKALGIPVIMETSDRGMIDIERFDLEPNRPILHGLIDHLDIAKVKEARTNEEKVPYILPMLGVETVSWRMKASMVEIEQTTTTWPQLASAVTLGGGLGADVCRRIALDQFHDSGRYFVDVEDIVSDKNKPKIFQPDISLNPSISNEEMIKLIEDFKPINVTHEIQLELDRDTITELVKAATRAPSGANGQTWKWKYYNKNLYLFYDGIYVSSVLDCEGTTSFVGLGAATENLVLKAHSLNLEVLIDNPPLDKTSKLVAVFRFFDKSASHLISGLEPHICDELSEEIYNRLTNRTIGPRLKINRSKFEYLKSLVKTVPGAELLLIDDEEQLAIIGEITAKMDQLRVMHPKGHQDFRLEMQWTPEQARANGYGIDVMNTVDLTVSELAGWHIVKEWPVIKLLNDWNLGSALGKIQRKCIAGASAVGLLTMPKYSHGDFYIGGRALERLWLGATKEKISVHPASISTLMFNTFTFMSEEIFPPSMRGTVKKMRDDFYNQFSIDLSTGVVLFLRFCIANDPKGRSVRFPIDQILSFGK
jgi:molybdopterin/thiamine biosynthesis adenylyltransferase